MHKLEKFLEQVNKNLTRQLGEVDYNSLPYATKESTWIIWNKKRIYEELNTQHWLFNPKNEDYDLMISIINEDTVSLQYIEVKEEGKGMGTEIVNCVLDAADDFDITVEVFASPFKTKYANVPVNKLTRKMLVSQQSAVVKLMNWYRSFDFKSISKKEPYKLIYNS